MADGQSVLHAQTNKRRGRQSTYKQKPPDSSEDGLYHQPTQMPVDGDSLLPIGRSTESSTSLNSGGAELAANGVDSLVQRLLAFAIASIEEAALDDVARQTSCANAQQSRRQQVPEYATEVLFRSSVTA